MLKYKNIKIRVLVCFFLLARFNYVKAQPIENANANSEAAVPSQAEIVKEGPKVTLDGIIAENGTKSSEEPDLSSSENVKQEQTLFEEPDLDESADNEAAASNFDPTIYGGLISPNAFQEYLNQFGSAFPYAAPYPAPVYAGYAPPAPVYPSPYVVQTGYEGYLVPSTTDSTTSTTTSSTSTTSSPTTSLMRPFTVLGNILSTLMMSTLFKIFAGIVSTLGMVFFSGVFMDFLCNYTPLCDISFRAVSSLRRKDNANRLGHMIAEGMTPERVKRATEFVQNAIKKYQELQESLEIKENNKNLSQHPISS